MATAINVTNAKQDLSCSICQDTFHEMTVSSCFHTFCQKCLDGHLRSSRGKGHYVCPICNISVSLSSDLALSRRSRWYDRESLDDAYPNIRMWNDYCDSCRGRVLAVNRCLGCNESFCGNCTMAHMRDKASRHFCHKVVPLWGYDTKERSFDESQKFCPRHRNEEILVVCKQCDLLLCLICKHMEHEHHVTKLISEEADNVRRDLTDILQEHMGLLESLRSRKEMLHTNKGHIARGLDNELAKVRHQASKLQLQIEREKVYKERELIDHYETSHKTNVDSYGEVNDDYKEYNSAVKEAQILLDKDSDVHLVKEGPRVYTRLNTLERSHTPGNSVNPTKSFVSGEINDRQLDNMFGYVKDADDRENMDNETGSHKAGESPARIGAEHIASFQIPFRDGIGYIYGIAPADENKAWFTMLDHNEVMLVDTKGTVKDQVEIGESCEGVARDWHGGCFVSCPNSKSLKRILVIGSTKIETIVEELQEDPHGLASLRTEGGYEELFVCLNKVNVGGFPSYFGQKGSIRVFTFWGQDVGRSFSLQAPVRIDVDLTGEHLCISDHSNGCVIVCDKTGQQVTSVFSGSQDAQVFRPLGVCFDPFGGVLIADWDNNRIQRITKEGDLIQNLLDKLDGPQSIAVDDANQLWIGCKQGHVSVYKLE